MVQGTVEEAYVVDTLHLQPVKFPDFTTVYTSLKTHQIDAWVAPAMEATNVMRPGDTAVDRRVHVRPGQFRGVRGGQRQPAADRCAERRPGRRHRRRHLVAAVHRLGSAAVAAGLETRDRNRR